MPSHRATIRRAPPPACDTSGQCGPRPATPQNRLQPAPQPPPPVAAKGPNLPQGHRPPAARRTPPWQNPGTAATRHAQGRPAARAVSPTRPATSTVAAIGPNLPQGHRAPPPARYPRARPRGPQQTHNPRTTYRRKRVHRPTRNRHPVVPATGPSLPQGVRNPAAHRVGGGPEDDRTRNTLKATVRRYPPRSGTGTPMPPTVGGR